jgi:transcriptional regulator with PAS, ATPase and Fis domain
VLITGETGSGKEVAARAIHARSRRCRGPFLCLNCAAIPASLLESFLFGYVKGAFTGADRDTTGMLEAAHGGTLLLDEIGELTASAQAALLRFLDQRRITRLGSTRERPVDVRILAATNRDINRMCSAGTFREDLLHRINAVNVRVPPLREREEDILPLAQRFLAQACQANHRDVEGFEPEAARVLRWYRWPGNVRELRNVIERAVVLSSKPLIRVEDLPEGLQGLHEPDQKQTVPVDPIECTAGADLDLRQRVTRIEAELIIEALRRTGGNRTAAARLLCIPIRTLSRKMETYKIRSLGFGSLKE